MYTELFPVTYYFYPLLEGDYRPGAHQEAFNALLRGRAAEGQESLLYVHIPYCHDLCSFCPFHIKIASGEDVYGRYTDALCREMELLAEYPYVAERAYSAVYFGGGSPSLFAPEYIEKILLAIRRHFRLAPHAEVSFEGEPRTLGNLALLELLKAYGVQRISFGLQTYDEAQRERFNIQASLADVERVTDNARRVGFADINVDMMYDLPGQNVTTLDDDIRHLAAAGYDSVDYYNLHYFAFPKPFKQAMERGDIPAKPNADMHFALAQEIRWRMAALGYDGVADQVFSRKGKVCEYFRLLWGGGDGDHAAETVAVGSSARGYLQGLAYMNTGDMGAYLAALERGHLPVAKVSSRLETAENRGAVFFPKFFRVAKKRRAAVGSVTPELWKAWLDSGLVRETPEAYELTERGRLWTTNMMRDALEPWQRDLAQSSLTLIAKKPGVRTGSF